MSSSLPLFTRLLTSVGIGVGITIAGSLGYWCYKAYKQNQIPKKWRRIGTLAELYIFPVKSCATIKLAANKEAHCGVLGLYWEGIRDRSLVLLDDSNGIVTARTYPKMIIIKSEITATGVLRVSYEKMTPLEINFTELSNEKPTKSQIVHTNVFGSHLDVALCGQVYDQWFSQAILGKPAGLRLSRFHYAAPVRPVIKNMSHEPFLSRKDTGTLGDATSYMLMNLSSVADLNKRLAEPVPPIQFRGNFYVKMDHDEPYAEDNWCWIKIGEDAVFRGVAPCTRCIVPNVNPLNGERHADLQPLKTLRTYRKAANYAAPPLGLHMGLRRFGFVKLNDVIYVADNA